MLPLGAAFIGLSTLMSLLLVLEHLETLPESNLCLQIGDYRFETLQIKDNIIKHIIIFYNCFIKSELKINTLPLPLQPVAYVSPAWYLESLWYEWTVR